MCITGRTSSAGGFAAGCRTGLQYLQFHHTHVFFVSHSKDFTGFPSEKKTPVKQRKQINVDGFKVDKNKLKETSLAKSGRRGAANQSSAALRHLQFRLCPGWCGCSSSSRAALPLLSADAIHVPHAAEAAAGRSILHALKQPSSAPLQPPAAHNRGKQRPFILLNYAVLNHLSNSPHRPENRPGLNFPFAPKRRRKRGWRAGRPGGTSALWESEAATEEYL